MITQIRVNNFDDTIKTVTMNEGNFEMRKTFYGLWGDYIQNIRIRLFIKRTIKMKKYLDEVGEAK